MNPLKTSNISQGN